VLNTRQVKVAISDNSFAFSVLCRQFLESTSLGLRHLLRERNFASGVFCDAITPGRAPAEAKTDTAVVL
jgi:hypothetical protein